MLCAICLETLEEIYPYTLEERLMEGARIQVKNGKYKEHPELSDDQRIEAAFKANMETYQDTVESEYRLAILERLGLM